MSAQPKNLRKSLSKSYPKNIFCLESLWNENVEKKLSVLPLLEVTEKAKNIRFIHLTCNTVCEFKFNIKFLKRKKSYQILYLAFHGVAEGIQLADGTCLALDELAILMNDDFEDLIVHFSSCNTLKAKEETLVDFVSKTNIRMLSGFTTDVGWTESAALELLYFSSLQQYKNVKYLNAFFQKSYPDLIKLTGFKTFVR